MRQTLLLTVLNSQKRPFLLLCLNLFFYQVSFGKTIYINDSSTDGDRYTKAIGNDLNDGLSPDKPKLTLVAAYTIALEGDIIYVDNGHYDETDFRILAAENPKKIQIIRAEINTEVFEKNPLPPEQKNSPDIFYIINDKPVSQEEYLQHLQYASRKK